MKFSKWYFATRCALCAVLGVVLSLAGVHVFTWRGAAVFAVLLALAVADGVHEICAVHRAFDAGRRDMADFLVRKGWRV
jgi:hypothetical protein